LDEEPEQAGCCDINCFSSRFFEKLDDIRCSKLSDQQLAEEPVRWVNHVQFALVRPFCHSRCPERCSLSFLFAEHRGKAFLCCPGHPERDVFRSEPFWSCAMSPNSHLLEHKIHARNQEMLEGELLDVVIWEEEWEKKKCEFGFGCRIGQQHGTARSCCCHESNAATLTLHNQKLQLHKAGNTANTACWHRHEIDEGSVHKPQSR